MDEFHSFLVQRHIESNALNTSREIKTYRTAGRVIPSSLVCCLHKLPLNLFELVSSHSLASLRRKPQNIDHNSVKVSRNTHGGQRQYQKNIMIDKWYTLFDERII